MDLGRLLLVWLSDTEVLSATEATSLLQEVQAYHCAHACVKAEVCGWWGERGTCLLGLPTVSSVTTDSHHPKQY